jgi:hypothetical protein
MPPLESQLLFQVSSLLLSPHSLARDTHWKEIFGCCRLPLLLYRVSFSGVHLHVHALLEQKHAIIIIFGFEEHHHRDASGERKLNFHLIAQNWVTSVEGGWGKLFWEFKIENIFIPFKWDYGFSSMEN